MDRTVELALMDELRELRAEKSFFLDPEVTTNPVSHYTDEAHFEAEQKAIFKKLPQPIAHVSEVAEKGDFVRRDIGGLPVLVTRDKEGQINAFLNVCRHRGTRLVDEEKGCKHRFSCPYHAWTYGSNGNLLAAPHLKDGFPGVEKSDFSLKRLPVAEKFGLIWVKASLTEGDSAEPDFGDLDGELSRLGLETMVIKGDDRLDLKANWKILVEGGIEAYHFRIAHRTTVGPHLEDNLSSYKMFGRHMRSILPRTTMSKLPAENRDDWRLRDHANVLYNLFPTTSLLVMQDHVVWISSVPLSAEHTINRIVTLAPTVGALAEGKDDEHWSRNHDITMATLQEDFVIGESVQSGAKSGANDVMTFGRFEGALDQFNKVVADMMAS